MPAEQQKEPRCIDTRPCFAKSNEKDEVDAKGKKIMRCTCLTRSYKKDGQCPFCKPRQEWTNGVFYPNKKSIQF